VYFSLCLCVKKCIAYCVLINQQQKNLMNHPHITVVYFIDAMASGGTEKQLALLIKHLDRARFQPVLICLRDCSDAIDRAELDCRVIELGIKKLFSLSAVRALRAITKLLKENPATTIVQTFFQDATCFGVVAARLAGIQRVYSSRRDLGFWHTKKELFKMRLMNRFVAGILVNSQAIQKTVVEKEGYPADKITVIHNALEYVPTPKEITEWRAKTRAQYGISMDETVIGIVSNLNRLVKRVDRFIELAARVAPAMPQARFMIIGDGPLRPELEGQAKTLGILDKCVFCGSLNHTLECVAAFDIALNTSDSEGFSNSVLEYMACGRPIVATDNPGNAELISHEKTGLLSPIGDVAQCAEALMRLIADDTLRERIGHSAKEYVTENYTLEKMIARQQEYYERVLRP
jgi:L-malate glycosyltransferase